MSQPTLHRVEQACAQLLQRDEPVTFNAVATIAGINRTSLYRNPQLRAVVEEHRAHSHDPHTLSGLSSEIAHLRTAVEQLATRVRRHEEQLRRLNATTRRRKTS
jgi:hypothetical protein